MNSFIPLSLPTAKIITDLPMRRAAHQAAKRSPSDATLVDLRDSLALMSQQTTVNEWKVSQAKNRIVHAVEELAKLTSDPMAAQFVEQTAATLLKRK